MLWTVSSSEKKLVVGFYEHGNEPSCSLKRWKFLE
jgi:hypothetical protein